MVERIDEKKETILLANVSKQKILHTETRPLAHDHAQETDELDNHYQNSLQSHMRPAPFIA